MLYTEVVPIGTALPVRRTVIGRQCNSAETAQPGDRTTNPGIVMPERYASSQRVDSLARVVIIPATQRTGNQYKGFRRGVMWRKRGDFITTRAKQFFAPCSFDIFQ